MKRIFRAFPVRIYIYISANVSSCLSLSICSYVDHRVCPSVHLSVFPSVLHVRPSSFRHTVKNNLAYQHVKFWKSRNFDVASVRFRWSQWTEAHIVCGFSHTSSESRRCNRLSADFRVWHENVMDYFLQCSFSFTCYQLRSDIKTIIFYTNL